MRIDKKVRHLRIEINKGKIKRIKRLFIQNRKKDRYLNSLLKMHLKK